MSLYFYPRLSPNGWDTGYVRLGEYSGLGNLLMTWARCITIARKYNAQVIEPTWRQVAVRHIVRRSLDRRSYGNLFSCPPNHIHGLRKLWLLLTLKRMTETEFNENESGTADGRIVMFSGIRGDFLPMVKDHEFVARSLNEIVQGRHKKGLCFDFEGSISAHIRRGDFHMTDRLTDIEWFVEKVSQLRTIKYFPVYVFSDGTDEELAPLMDLGGVQRLFFGSAMADLLALSKSNILLASKGSTYSLWASYLGRFPVIWPDHQVMKLYYERPVAEMALRLGEEIPSDFMEVVA